MPSSYIGLPAITARFMSAAVRGVNKSALKFEAKAKQAAPVEEGRLRGGIHTTPASTGGSLIEVMVSTGPESDDYAIVQHEHTEFNHPRGGGAKYMEGPLRAHGPEHAATVQAELRKAF